MISELLCFCNSSCSHVTTIGRISCLSMLPIFNLFCAIGLFFKKFFKDLTLCSCFSEATLRPDVLYRPLLHSLQSTAKTVWPRTASTSISCRLVVLKCKFFFTKNPFATKISATIFSNSFQSKLSITSSIVLPLSSSFCISSKSI